MCPRVTADFRPPSLCRDSDRKSVCASCLSYHLHESAMRRSRRTQQARELVRGGAGAIHRRRAFDHAHELRQVAGLRSHPICASSARRAATCADAYAWHGPYEQTVLFRYRSRRSSGALHDGLAQRPNTPGIDGGGVSSDRTRLWCSLEREAKRAEADRKAISFPQRRAGEKRKETTAKSRDSGPPPRCPTARWEVSAEPKRFRIYLLRFSQLSILLICRTIMCFFGENTLYRLPRTALRELGSRRKRTLYVPAGHA
jgi:hypothetical protein